MRLSVQILHLMLPFLRLRVYLTYHHLLSVFYIPKEKKKHQILHFRNITFKSEPSLLKVCSIDYVNFYLIR